MDLIPPDTIRRIEAYNTLLSKRFRSPGRIFSIPQSTDNYIRVLTWGGSYIGNKSNSPLDEPNCQDYTGSQSLFRIDNNNQFLDARTVIDAKTVDAMDIVQGLFPETCKTSSDGTCTNTKLARAPKIPWTTLRTQAQLLGLQDAFTSDFGIDKTDGADWCTRLRKQWSGIVPTGSFVGQTCQYKHVGGIGLFDLPRQIALVDSLRWMHARLTTGQSPFSTYRAFPMEFSCSDVGRPSSRRLDPSDVCQTNNPDAQTILATANANYLASLLAIQTPQCNDPKESDLAALRSPEYSAQNLPPIPPDSCSSSRQKAGHRDIGRYEVNELMPGNKLPGTRALFATCHETKKTTRTINGKRVKCTDTSF
jgi:hypothetical protein